MGRTFQFNVWEQSAPKYPGKQEQRPVSVLQSPELAQSLGHLKSSQCGPQRDQRENLSNIFGKTPPTAPLRGSAPSSSMLKHIRRTLKQ